MLKRLTPAQRHYLKLKISRHMEKDPEFEKKVFEEYDKKMKALQLPKKE